jgi:hypothetical protein
LRRGVSNARFESARRGDSRTDCSLVALDLIQAVAPAVVNAWHTPLAHGVQFGVPPAALAFVRRSHVPKTREQVLCKAEDAGCRWLLLAREGLQRRWELGWPIERGLHGLYGFRAVDERVSSAEEKDQPVEWFGSQREKKRGDLRRNGEDGTVEAEVGRAY